MSIEVVLSQEFIDWSEAQAAIRAWIDSYPGQPIPQYLKEWLERTQRDYEASKRNRTA